MLKLISTAVILVIGGASVGYGQETSTFDQYMNQGTSAPQMPAPSSNGNGAYIVPTDQYGTLHGAGNYNNGDYGVSGQGTYNPSTGNGSVSGTVSTTY